MSKRNAKQYPVEQVAYRDGSARYAQNADGTITIRLTGRIAENLNRAAEAMNAVSWTEGDNTATSVLACFVCWQTFGNWNDKPPFSSMCGLSEELENISYAVDTYAGDDETLDKERRDELRAAFQRKFRFRAFDEELRDFEAANPAK